MRVEFAVAKVPFAESPWEIELSFGYGWQIESVRILSARSIEAYERERRSGRREILEYLDAQTELYDRRAKEVTLDEVERIPV